MRAFVTGATGFIGGRVARKLLERGYEVTCLVRDPSKDTAVQLQEWGAELVQGDILDPQSMRRPMRGADVVFHIAGWYKLGVSDSSPALRINVYGTRAVLNLANELGIPNIVYTSTVGIFGNTRGRVVDETFQRDTPFGSEYTRSKTMADELAEDLIAQGAPIRIVLPGGVYGPGDPSVLGLLLRMFLQGLFPVLPGANSGLAMAHVEDVAEGHILAAEKGRPGEKYILAGPSLSYGEVLQMVAHAAQRPAPIMLSSWPVPLLIGIAKMANRLFALPVALHPETLQNLNNTTFWASGAKARQELGWQLRPLREGGAETGAWELLQMRGGKVVLQQ